jgi:hypothetical protein
MYHKLGTYVYRKNPNGVWEFWANTRGGWMVSSFQLWDNQKERGFLSRSTVIVSYKSTWAEPYYGDI